MSIDYGWEKLHSAIHCLCGKRDQRSRLASAVGSLHVLVTTYEQTKSHLPEADFDEFWEFMKKMTSREAVGDEGNIVATVNHLDEGEISKAVEKIISFYDNICRHKKPFV